MARILIVDDESGYLKHLTLILGDDGHEVASAETGEEAVRETVRQAIEAGRE